MLHAKHQSGRIRFIDSASGVQICNVVHCHVAVRVSREPFVSVLLPCGGSRSVPQVVLWPWAPGLMRVDRDRVGGVSRVKLKGLGFD